MAAGFIEDQTNGAIRQDTELQSGKHRNIKRIEKLHIYNGHHKRTPIFTNRTNQDPNLISRYILYKYISHIELE